MAQNQQLSVLAQVAPTNTGTAGQVLTSAGSSSPAYWGSAAGGIVGYTGSAGAGYAGSAGAGYTGSAGAGYTGSASTVAGYAGSAGPAGGYTGSSGYTGSAITISYTAIRQQFTGDGTTTVFAVSGGYTTGAISVFYNGTLMRNGSDVTVTNGSTIIFAIAPLNGGLIDVIGTIPTPYSSITPVSYSVSFNGSSQYLTVPSNTALTIGTSSATVEFWMYPLSNSGIQRIICSTNGGFSSGTFVVRWNGGTFVGGAWGAYITSSTLPTLNAWNHVAWVGVAGTSQSLYLNGVLVGTNTSYNVTEAIQYVGCYYTGGGEYYNGYLSNVRVVKGVAVYTGAFMPPTTPLSAVQSAVAPSIQAITGTQTSLLTCNGPTIVDGSTNAFTITNNGTATVSTAVVPTFTTVTIINSGYTGSAGAGYTGSASSGYTGSAGLGIVGYTGSASTVVGYTGSAGGGGGGNGYTGSAGAAGTVGYTGSASTGSGASINTIDGGTSTTIFDTVDIIIEGGGA